MQAAELSGQFPLYHNALRFEIIISGTAFSDFPEMSGSLRSLP